MSAKSSAGTPDVWEDDWERAADNFTGDSTPPPPEKKVSSKVTKAQRRAQQAEFNRQLWAEAESPQTFHYLEARSDEVPLKQEFKPTVTVLSRKPQLATRQSSSVNSATAGVARLGLSAEGGAEDSDDEDSKAPEPTPEERHAIALKNLEEKQRKYEEVRERLFGSPSAPTSGASSPRSSTPPKSHEGRGKGRSRGGVRDNRDKRDPSAASSKSGQLYDPNHSTKPNSGFIQRKDRQQAGQRPGSEPQSPRQPYRHPRGPDSSGRGGFGGFRGRGAKAG